MMRILRLALRELGLRPLLRMAIYRTAIRSGWYRWRTPQWTWAARPLATWLRPDIPDDPAAYLSWRKQNAPQSGFCQADAHALDLSPEGALQDAALPAHGRVKLFGELEVDLGFPPAWNLLPSVEPGTPGKHVDMSRHWSGYQLERLPGDVKLLWEPARFGWAFDLLRAFVLTGNVSHAETFWKIFDSWQVNNPPNTGLHWHSAQEVAFRTIALSYAVEALFPYWEGHPSELQRVVQCIAAGAARIPPTLIYARAQDNNHLLLEAAALLSTGLLFPELRAAERWEKIGRRTLVEALSRQVFPDGGYVQHSSNYHRLAVQAVLWAGIVARRCGSPLPDGSLAQLSAMLDWIHTWMEPGSGALPNFGPNDGSQLLPLSDLAHADFRPTAQATAMFLYGERSLSAGPWDDLAYWLGLVQDDAEDVRSGERRPQRADFPQSGLYRLGGDKARGSLRAARFTNRPGHSDQMHFDLWWRGLNLACDAGTYLYTAPQPWRNAFSGAWCHNTLTVDGYEPMLRAGRFLWLDWSTADLLCRWSSPDGRLDWIEAVRNGFRPRGINHRRSVLRCEDLYWVVVDYLYGNGEHTVRINWLTPDVEWRDEEGGLSLKTAVGEAALRMGGASFEQAIYRAGAALNGGLAGVNPELCGWRSPTYAVLQPALQIMHEASVRLPVRLQSIWALGAAGVDPPQLVWADDLGPGQTALREVAWGESRWEIPCTSS
jgi:hypothetical protein